jgi:putative DNA primase/helicase
MLELLEPWGDRCDPPLDLAGDESRRGAFCRAYRGTENALGCRTTRAQIGDILMTADEAERWYARFKAEPDAVADERLVLDPKAPWPSSQKLIGRHWTQGHLRTLHHDGSDFLEYRGTHYERVEDRMLANRLWQHLDQADKIVKTGDGKVRVRFEPTTTRVNDVLNAVRAVSSFPSRIDLPAWIGDDPLGAANEILPCVNGLLHVPTRALHSLTPAFVSTNALPYAFDREAPAPEKWLSFLRSLWPDDCETINTLQEMFGLILTADTRHQKIFLVLGPRRSGKGTIARVLRALVGIHNTAGPTLGSLGEQFGLEPLIDKRLATVSDARLGRKADVGLIAERLLSISGEDALSVGRKYKTAWHGKLPTQIVILSNEVPNLRDASGALASRYLVLSCTCSFLGREDHGLTDRLLTELPGILNWSLDGLARLRERGRLVQPKASAEALGVIEDLGSPIAAFIRERCRLGPQHSIPVDDLYRAYCGWAKGQGLPQPIKAHFGRDVHAAEPGISHTKPRAEGRQTPTYNGIALAVVSDGIFE